MADVDEYGTVCMTQQEQAERIIRWWDSHSTEDDRRRVVHQLGWDPNTIRIDQDGLVSRNDGRSFSLDDATRLYTQIVAPPKPDVSWLQLESIQEWNPSYTLLILGIVGFCLLLVFFF